MNRTWLTILNEIINSETNELSVEVKCYNKSMKVRVDKYHHYMRNHSKIDNIISDIKLDSIRSIMINLENLLGYNVTEIQEDDSTNYIIKKDGIKHIKCNSKFLYGSDDIIPDCIDDEYTGYFELKKTSAILQNITFKTASHKVCINLTYFIWLGLTSLIDYIKVKKSPTNLSTANVSTKCIKNQVHTILESHKDKNSINEHITPDHKPSSTICSPGAKKKRHRK